MAEASSSSRLVGETVFSSLMEESFDGSLAGLSPASLRKYEGSPVVGGVMTFMRESDAIVGGCQTIITRRKEERDKTTKNTRTNYKQKNRLER